MMHIAFSAEGETVTAWVRAKYLERLTDAEAAAMRRCRVSRNAPHERRVCRRGSLSDTFIWTSANPAVADVDNDGLVTLSGIGTVTVKAMGKDGAGVYALTVTAKDGIL